MKLSYIAMDFAKTFTGVNLDLMQTDEKGYDYAMLLIYIDECSNGYKVKKINKTTEKGTTVVYEAIANANDFKCYKEMIADKINESNDKWNENVQLS